MSRTKRRHVRPMLVAVWAVAIAMPLAISPALGAASTVVKVNGTDIFCPLDTADAGGFLFAITRDRTDGEGFAFVDMLVEPADPQAPVLVGGKDDPALTSTGFHDSWEVAEDASGNVIGTAR